MGLGLGLGLGLGSVGLGSCSNAAACVHLVARILHLLGRRLLLAARHLLPLLPLLPLLHRGHLLCIHALHTCMVKAAESATLEAASLGTRGTDWVPSGPASNPWDYRAAQSRQARYAGAELGHCQSEVGGGGASNHAGLPCSCPICPICPICPMCPICPICPIWPNWLMSMPGMESGMPGCAYMACSCAWSGLRLG